MPYTYKTRRLSLLIAALMVSVAPSTSSAQTQFPPVDYSRNVLSFADTLESVLPSVVRIGRLAKNSKDKVGLAGIGSGAVIDAEKGYVVTNAHVVKDGLGFLINLPDGRIVKARLVGIDLATDIAVLQADDMRVDAVNIGDSDRLRVGDVVFAVGYPLGLEQSISLGIISGLGRSASSDSLQDFIQTDAAINSGNSGGPLLDSRGRLIGINTAIVSKSGGNNGIGFSVPANLAGKVTEQLISHGTVKRGSIGIVMDRVNEEASEKVGINHWDGALVANVRPESAAELAGLKEGDVITKFDGKKIKTPNTLRALIGVSIPDQPYSVTYVRENGIQNVVQVKITAFKAPPVESLEQLGVFLRPVKSKDNGPRDVEGVYVRRVIEGSPAEKAGLKEGDIIGAINNEIVTSKHVCDRLITESKGRAQLLVYRFGVPIPVIIES